MKIGCPCGVEFQVVPSRASRSKYCSKSCFYKYRVRPSGLKYDIKRKNPSWFEIGREALTGVAHPQWKGDEVGYRQLHDWVKANRNKQGGCEHCGAVTLTQWANKSHEYRRDLADWIELCRKCHGRHDSGDNWGRGVERFGAYNRKAQIA